MQVSIVRKCSEINRTWEWGPLKQLYREARLIEVIVMLFYVYYHIIDSNLKHLSIFYPS